MCARKIKKRSQSRRRQPRRTRRPDSSWPAVGTRPPRNTRFAVPICDYADFLAICGLSDDDQGRTQWETWKAEQQEWKQLLRKAGYRPVDVIVDARSYRRFLDDNEEALDTQLSLWNCASRMIEHAKGRVLSINALLISAVDLEAFPCVGGAEVDNPTARIRVDAAASQVHVSILLASSEKPREPRDWTFQEIGTLDLSDTPQLLQQIAAEEVPWFGCTVQRSLDGEWWLEFVTADSEGELLDNMHLNTIKRFLELFEEELDPS